jgi:hypothetical protein
MPHQNMSDLYVFTSRIVSKSLIFLLVIGALVVAPLQAEVTATFTQIDSSTTSNYFSSSILIMDMTHGDGALITAAIPMIIPSTSESNPTKLITTRKPLRKSGLTSR